MTLGWDGDGDGIDDLVTVGPGWQSVIRFASPLSAVLAEEAETAWTPAEFAADLLPKAALGDLTGDGRPELGLSETDFTTEVESVGAAWIVVGGDVASKPLDEIPLQSTGTELGQAWGWSMASGDLDGDGQLDLAIGAKGISPGAYPGSVHLFFGPVTSIDPAAAAFVMYGSGPFTSFGCAVELSSLGGECGDRSSDAAAVGQVQHQRLEHVPACAVDQARQGIGTLGFGPRCEHDTLTALLGKLGRGFKAKA